MNTLFFNFKSSSRTFKLCLVSFKISKQNECMVEICISSISFLVKYSDNLSFNSCAAFLVKVITRKVEGSSSFSSIRYFILSTRTLVLPEPGPASIKRGLLSKYLTASFCSSFNLNLILSLYFF